MLKTYTVTKPAITQRQKKIYVLVGVSVLVALIALLVQHRTVWILAAIVGAVCLGIAQTVGQSREEPFAYLDQELVFEGDKIIIGNEVFPIAQLQNLTLQLLDYDGMQWGSRYVSILNGTDNYLSFRLGSTAYAYVVYIDSEMQFNAFRDVFEKWYINGFGFTELNRADQRVYLFEELDYLQKVAFQQKYNIRS